jgi:hypothetical protein
MSKRKKRPSERVTLSCAHKWKDNKQLSSGGMMIKEQTQLLGIKRVNKMEERKQLASWCTKLLKDHLARDGIKCIYHIHL